MIRQKVNNIESLDVLGEGATIRAEAFRQFVGREISARWQWIH